MDLRDAIEAGDREAAGKAIKQGWIGKQKLPGGSTLAMGLVALGWDSQLAALLAMDGDRLMDKSSDGSCALSEAAARGSSSCVGILLDAWEAEEVYLSERAARIELALAKAKRRMESIAACGDQASPSDKEALSLLLMANRSHPVQRVETHGPGFDVLKAIEDGSQQGT